MTPFDGLREAFLFSLSCGKFSPSEKKLSVERWNDAAKAFSMKYEIRRRMKPTNGAPKSKTHYDTIRNMSIDRLALFLTDMCDGSNREYWLAWLQQEVDDADTR